MNSTPYLPNSATRSEGTDPSSITVKDSPKFKIEEVFILDTFDVSGEILKEASQIDPDEGKSTTDDAKFFINGSNNENEQENRNANVPNDEVIVQQVVFKGENVDKGIENNYIKEEIIEVSEEKPNVIKSESEVCDYSNLDCFDTYNTNEETDNGKDKKASELLQYVKKEVIKGEYGVLDEQDLVKDQTVEGRF